MKAPPETSRRLRLELLETRTLLAADGADPFGLVADFGLAAHALSGTGDYQATFSTKFGNHQLVITGTSNSSLTIDLAQLPSFVTDLDISSFDSVTVTGTEHVNNLILSGIGSVAASGLTIDDQVVAKNVASLSLAHVGMYATVSGAEMSLSINTFSEFSYVFSDVGVLTFSTEAPKIEIVQVSKMYSEPTLKLTDLSEIGRVKWNLEPGSSAHLVLPSVDSGGSTPDTPGGTGSTPGDGGNNPGPTGTDPGPLVIIAMPLDEQMRAFLVQLHQLLHSTDANADQQVLDLLSHGSFATQNIGALANAQDGLLSTSGPSTGIPAAELIPDPGTLIPSFADTSKFGQPLPEQMVWSVQDSVLVRSNDVVTSQLPDGLSLPNQINVDVSWPIAFPMANLPRSETPRLSATNEVHELTLGDRVQALGSYIIERVTAEFSPGQQSLVLLIDPQPTRSAAASRKPEQERNAAIPAFDATAPVLYV